MVKKLVLILGIILVATYTNAQVLNMNDAQAAAKKETS
jgi:hypothetical protein